MSEELSIRERWRSLQLRSSAPDTEMPETEPDEAPATDPESTFIGSGALFEGTLRIKGDFQIDSEFHGSLATDGVLTVGPSGTVEGDIQAREVIVAGAVVGDIAARRQVVLRAGSRLHGDIETACLEIERHAYFVGRTAMTRPQADPRPVPPDDTVVVPAGPATPVVV